MKRCFCLAIIIAGMLTASGNAVSASAFMAAFGGNPTASIVVLADDHDKDARPDPKDQKSIRRGLGARFWGGPYWGYGPRWGHPCRQCRTICESEDDSADCRRCRLRCGW